LVGAVCSGKSEVARRFRELGAVVYEADALVRKLYERADVRAEVHALLGDAVFDASGAVSRGAIADRVFGPKGNAELRRRLTEEIIFPRTGQVLGDQLAAFRAGAGEGDVLVVDAPTLFEAGRSDWCDRILWVSAPLERRRQWASERGWSPVELDRRDAAMLPEAVKRRRADFTIQNSGTLGELHQAVDRVWAGLMEGT
jgi:dephospho-CoA kinase